MIPKKIHYCWFGEKALPKLAIKCIESWKKYAPDYEIIVWNEENFDINCNKYVEQAYKNKKYAFVSDYVRLYVLYNYGGIYMDTDVELVKPLDIFLDRKAFSGFESKNTVPTGIIGAESHNSLIKELLEYYKNITFVKENGDFDFTTNVKIITDIFSTKGLQLDNTFQEICGFTFYPQEYFCPVDLNTRKCNITKNTYCIHWFSGSWLPIKTKIKGRIYRILVSIFGETFSRNIINFMKGVK